MALILNIESSTTVCSVALGQNGETADLEELNDGFTHAENLAVFVERVLSRNDISVAELNAIAVSEGPGSYTGLRIGLSLAKGLCYAARLPLIGVPTLQAMCLHPDVKKELDYLKDAVMCPMLDARRMEVYTALYDFGLKQVKEPHAHLLTEESFSDFLSQDPVIFFGNGSEKFKPVLDNASAYFVDSVVPSAAYMSMLAELSFQESDFEDVAYFVPKYIKDVHTTTPKKAL